MSLFSVLSVGASGMAAQRARAELLVENLANAETTRTPEGGPYRRKDVVFESTTVSSPFASVFSSQLQSMGGVAVSGVVTDMSDPERRYLPGHPTPIKGRLCGQCYQSCRAGTCGPAPLRPYVRLAAVKDMIQRSIDLTR